MIRKGHDRLLAGRLPLPETDLLPELSRLPRQLARKVKSSRRLSEPLITIQDQRMRQPPLLEKPLPLLLHFSLSIDMR